MDKQTNNNIFIKKENNIMNEKMKELESRKAAWAEQVQKQKEKFDEEARQIREEERRSKQSEKEKFLDDLTVEIAGEYDMSFEQARIIVDQAWDRGHSYGYQEVRIYAEDYAEWVAKIIKLQVEMDY